MRRAIPLAPLMLILVFGPAWAEDARVLGARVAQQGTSQGVAPCVACHGTDGAGREADGYPRIAGLAAGYLARQLDDFHSGKRRHPVMMPLAQGLTEPEIAAVSAYYAALPAPVQDFGALDGASTVPELARWGDWSGRGLPACAQCHGPEGAGIGPYFPALAGQHASYLKTQLQAWKSGARANDPLGLMRAVAARLGDEEIDALAAYYAAQPWGIPTPAPNAPAVDRLADAEAWSAADTDAGAASAPAHPAPGPGFRPPPRDEVPSGPFGEMVRLGQDIFLNTNTHPASAGRVGNHQACGHCHLDAGRLAGSAPLWAAWVAYPAYRAKTGRVDSFADRLQGCFTFSLNAQDSAVGTPPAIDSEVIAALSAYGFWLARGAPTGETALAGRGYPRLEPTALGADPGRGGAVYAAKCALCHGEDGAGVHDDRGNTLFPPLWGKGAYNLGAGMHAIDTAAAFIASAMPLGLGGSLSVQEAWDLAAYVNARERPRDPRLDGDPGGSSAASATAGSATR